MTQVTSQHTIDLEPVFQALHQPLELIDDPQRRDELQRFIAATRIYQERAVFGVISDLVARINEAATDTRVRLQYEAREFILAVEANTAAENAPDPMTRMDGDLEKVTIRLPKPLKERIDEAASDRGESLNTWYVRTLARGVMRHMRDRRPEDAGAFGHRGRLGRRRGRYGFAGEEEAIGRSSGE